MFFGSKEKKLKQAEEAAAKKEEAEFEAKYTAKTERKKIEKIITEADKSIANLMQKAAEAKSEGYIDVYKQLIMMIKTAKARKKQAKVFLYQMDGMQEMKKIADSSSQLLGSMNAVMSSLGKISLDKSAMMNMQKDFMATQRELDKQSMSIESALSGLDMVTDDMDIAQFSDDAIESEIDSMMLSGNIDGSSYTPSSSSNSFESELNHFKQIAKN